MKKFMLLYLSPVSAEEQMNVQMSPEDGKKMMDAWKAWFESNLKAVVEGGDPLGMAVNVNKDGESSAGKTKVAGFSIMQAESMDEVKAMLPGHPHYMIPGATIEVLEFMPISGME